MKINTEQPLSSADAELENLLREPPVQVPADFTQRVLADIDTVPQHSGVKVSWWQWLALLGGAVPGISKLLAFMFSLWLTVSAG